jgi:hypothetical protein
MSGLSSSSVIPLFNAVYHEYAICFGNFGGFTYPPYDEFWPKEFRAPNTETLLPAKYNTQLRMEQARTFVWGTQPMIVNYHAFAREARPVEMRFIAELVAKRKQHKDYFQYGRMMRAPQLANDHTTEIDIAQMSTYGYKTKGTNLFPHRKAVPMLYSCGWRNQEGNILLAFVNISEESKTRTFTIDLAEMGRNENYILYIDGVAQNAVPQSSYEIAIEGCSTKIFEFKKREVKKVDSIYHPECSMNAVTEVLYESKTRKGENVFFFGQEEKEVDGKKVVYKYKVKLGKDNRLESYFVNGNEAVFYLLKKGEQKLALPINLYNEIRSAGIEIPGDDIISIVYNF